MGAEAAASAEAHGEAVREGFDTCFRKKCTVHGLKVENIRASLCLSFETESDQSFEGMTARNCNRNNMLARM